jgi:hypothetical protein
MPNRCGLMHVRPAEEDQDLENSRESNAAKQQQPTQEELDTFWAGVQARLAQFTSLPAKVLYSCILLNCRFPGFLEFHFRSRMLLTAHGASVFNPFSTYL